MQYQTGAASSSADLLQQLVTWLVGIGWTQDRSATEGLGWTASLHNGGSYAHFRAAMNETVWPQALSSNGYSLNLFLGTGFNGANPWAGQTPGAPIGSASNPVGVAMRLSAGPFSNYYFFADAGGQNVGIVVQVTPGLYVHLGFGLSLNKAGAWTGGPYFFGSTSGFYVHGSPPAGTPGFDASSDCPFPNEDHFGAGCGFVRADVDSFTGKWIGITTSTSPDYGYTGKPGDVSMRGTGRTMSSNFPVYSYNDYPQNFQKEQTSASDGRANLLPLLLWVLRDGTTTGFSLLGSVPNVFFTNAVGNGFSSGDEYVLGGTTYKLFPNFAVVKQ